MFECSMRSYNDSLRGASTRVEILKVLHAVARARLKSFTHETSAPTVAQKLVAGNAMRYCAKPRIQ